MVDTQVVELLGRNRLVAELLRGGLEVALPLRDRGVDLVAYAELGRQVSAFSARPIQMKAATDRGFGVDRKYEKVSGLILAYVWSVADPAGPTFALSYAEAVGVAEEMGWTQTAAWTSGKYVTSSPSVRLQALLEPYKVVPGRWWSLVAGANVL